MNCEQARGLFSDYLDGILVSDQTERLEDHLSACPACPEELESWKAAGMALEAVLDADAVFSTSLDDFVMACTSGTEHEGRHARLVEWLAAPRRAAASTVAGGLAFSTALVLLVWFSSLGGTKAGGPPAFLPMQMQCALALDDHHANGGADNDL